jgi:hypothetical protein
LGRLFAVSRNSPNLRIAEDRRVKLRRFFRLIVEPKEWSNFLHSHHVQTLRPTIAIPHDNFPENSGSSNFHPLYLADIEK